MILRAGTILNDRYEILNTVGTGGMADVYRARDNMLQRSVAVKVLKEEYSTDAGFVAKFRREAQAAGGFSHPNIVSVYDVGDQNGMYYIVMELVEGITLKKYIEKTGRMPEREAVEVAMQVARGLEAAHEQGIIHRDVKPQNIIISREGKIKVADFGIARVTSTETISASTMGSVHYISPEQARGGACDARSDIYSLGITMFEMVTGQVPFDGENSVAVAIKHIQDPMPSPKQIEPGISSNMDKIILKCTQKNPAYRYPSMAALLLDLRKLIVSPGEDFVVLHSEEDTESSLHISRKDADILKAAGITSGGRDWMDAEQALLALEEGAPRAAAQQEEDRVAEEKAKRTEHLLSYIMLGIAVVILVLIIAIAFKACAIFAPPETQKTTTRAVTVPTNRTSVQTEEGTQTIPGTSATAITTQSPPSETTTQERPIETNPENTVVVPGFTGKSIEDAWTLAEETGLRLEMQDQPMPDVTEPVVVDQSYAEGTVVLIGTQITLWIAVKEDNSVYVPTSIVGKTVAEAGQILGEAGLSVSPNPEWKASQMVDYGKVIDCKPSMGSQVERGSQITLVISSGPVTVRMPGILGLSASEAVAALKTVGFNTGTYVHIREERIEESKYDPETVTKIDAMVNGVLKTVSPGDSVDLRGHVYLTLVAPYPEVPDILGRSDVDDVLTELTEIGFVPERVDDPESLLPVGRVCAVMTEDENGVRTDVQAGDPLPKKTKLFVYVSVITVPDNLVAKTVTQAIEMIEEVGLGYEFEDDIAPRDPDEAMVTAVTPISGSYIDDPDMKIMIQFYEKEEETTEPEEETTEPTEEETTEPTEETTEPTEETTAPPTVPPTEPPTVPPTVPPTEPPVEETTEPEQETTAAEETQPSGGETSPSGGE